VQEVERARKLIADACTGYTIADVDAREDKIVYTGGCTHEDYMRELRGRTIRGCERKGKVYVLHQYGRSILHQS
jgi:formamidopyrimidine-DNA glycosylase